MIEHDGDTDTNGAIVGALFGKWMKSNMIDENTLNNIQIIKECTFDGNLPHLNYLKEYHPIYNF